MGFILIGMYGALLLWFFWVCHKDARDRKSSAMCTTASAESGAAAMTPTEEAASEKLQGQHG